MSKIRISLILLDLICWVLSFVVMILWRVITTRGGIGWYSLEYLALATFLILVGCLLGKYRPLKQTRFAYITFSTTLSWLITCVTFYIASGFGVFGNLSATVAYIGIFMAMLLNLLYIMIYYFRMYAQYMDGDDIEESDDRAQKVEVLQVGEPRLKEEMESIEQSVKDYANEKVLRQLKEWVDLGSTNTMVVANSDSFSTSKLANYKYDTIVNLKLLNDIRGINRLFCLVNEKLPDGGEFVCCFRPQRVMKERIYKRYPKGLNFVIYCMFYMWRRVMPKLLTTSRLYFDITGGKDRVLSITEALGRLYYCGFEVVEEAFVDHMYYVKVRRASNPHPQSRSRRYGPLIKLLRVGKNGKKFNVYKMRTMHPYSEFLQKYVYDKVGLQEGGKMSDDMRVSTLGAFMRKYWLDELPMFINFFKGEMKFVGVRPLSSHYFSLYTKELQEKRTKFKPGLFPPFYADMPKTLDDIMASEMRYLEMCEKRGSFVTDITYMWRIFVNIVFKSARSK